MLHGSGERGTNNTSQVASSHVSTLIDRTESDYPAVLVVPQLATGSWGTFNSADHTSEILTSITSDYSIDTNRLYVTGLSLGGYGTMEYLEEYNVEQNGTFQFAAAAPLSGAYVSPSAAPQLSNVPIWLVHGAEDGVVPVDTSRDTYRAIAGLEPSDPLPFSEHSMGGNTAIDGELRYTEIAGLGHSGWSTMYGREELYNWMFAHTLEPLTGVAGDVNQDGELTSADIDDFVAGWRSDTRTLDKIDRTKQGDLNYDGRTDLSDAALLRHALQNAGLWENITAANVPEPSSAAVGLGLLGIAGMLRRRMQ